MSSLSNDAIQERLHKHFIPVWVSRDQYQLDPRSKEEHQELLRVDRAAKAAHLPGGAVAVFVIAPDGTVLASQNLHEAIDPQKLTALLDGVLAKQTFSARTAAARTATAAPLRPLYRRTEKDGVVLHVLTRFDERRKHYGVSEDWCELSAPQWHGFLPDDRAARGDSWEIPAPVTEKIARFFYPPGPNWRVQDSAVKFASLTARLVWRSDTLVLVHLTGAAEVSHPFGKDAPGITTAKLAGMLRYDPCSRTLTAFQLAATDATYAWLWRGKPQPEKISLAVELEK